MLPLALIRPSIKLMLLTKKAGKYSLFLSVCRLLFQKKFQKRVPSEKRRHRPGPGTEDEHVDWEGENVQGNFSLAI